VVQCLGSTGLLRLLGRIRPGVATILTYHGVTDQPRGELDQPELHIDAGVFTRQMHFLARTCRPTKLGDLVAMLREGVAIPAGTVCVLFDDAYANVARCAMPVLRELAIPACVFVATCLLGTDDLLWHDVLGRAARTLPRSAISAAGPFPAGLTEATWPAKWPAIKAAPDDERRSFVARVRGLLPEELSPGESRIFSEAELDRWLSSGLEVGSHTIAHPVLPSIADPALLEEELLGSRQRLEACCGQSVRWLAYPNGDYDERVREAAIRAGYEAAVITAPGQVRAGTDLFALPRCSGGLAAGRAEAAVRGIDAAVVGALYRRGIR
jgi:peptidoglycan/xylan/chitin deacetylase (PgdA/CDA1 family)